MAYLYLKIFSIGRAFPIELKNREKLFPTMGNNGGKNFAVASSAPNIIANHTARNEFWKKEVKAIDPGRLAPMVGIVATLNGGEDRP